MSQFMNNVHFVFVRYATGCPVSGSQSVLQVYDGLSYQIISAEAVVIPDLYTCYRIQGKRRFYLKHPVTTMCCPCNE